MRFNKTGNRSRCVSRRDLVAVSFLLLASILVTDKHSVRAQQRRTLNRENTEHKELRKEANLLHPTSSSVRRVTDSPLFFPSDEAFESVLKPPPRAAPAVHRGPEKGRQKAGHTDRCWKFHCHVGYVCAIINGRARCVCGRPGDCHHRKRRPVCASDGHLYLNHCELHRTACVRKVHLSIRHPLAACLDEQGTIAPTRTRDKDEPGRSSPAEGLQSPPPPAAGDTAAARVIVGEGSSLELLCDVRRIDEIRWTRNGHVIDDVSNELEILPNGALYFRDVSVSHSGSYRCYDSISHQEHTLLVNTLPFVTVHPVTQFHVPGEDVTLQCHAAGVPRPKVSWELNEEPLPTENSEHYRLLNNNHTLMIVRATNIVDTGAYKCTGRNVVGSSQDIATVFVETVDVPKYANEPYQVFVVFHHFGYTVFSPVDCGLQHEVSGHQRLFNSSSSSYRLSSEEEDEDEDSSTLCGSKGMCVWGEGVNVRNRFIYVTQPTLNRVIVIEIEAKFKAVEAISTDHRPGRLNYFDLYDQVWIVCCDNDEDESCGERGIRTSVVIREASEGKVHRQVHTQPVGNRFDSIDQIFLPQKSDFPLRLKHAYVSHRNERALYKLDLETLGYVKVVDLGPQNCVPRSLSIVAVGGKVVVHCHPPVAYNRSTSFVLDLVTDVILTSLDGDFVESFVSPDQRYLVLVHANGVLISVFEISENGDLRRSFNVPLEKAIGSLVFFPSERTGFTDYDFFVRLLHSESLVFVNATNGSTKTVRGTGSSSVSDDANSNNNNNNNNNNDNNNNNSRSGIINSGIFGNYLMVLSSDHVTVIDGQSLAIRCRWNNTLHANSAVWIDPLRL